MLSAQRLNALPKVMYLPTVSAATYPVHLVDVRFAAADRAAPVGHTRIQVPPNVLSPVEQGIHAGDAVDHAQFHQPVDKVPRGAHIDRIF